jgi:hypothetical protein
LLNYVPNKICDFCNGHHYEYKGNRFTIIQWESFETKLHNNYVLPLL